MRIGIVYNPIQNQLFTACKGQGAFLNGSRIFASKRTDIDLSVVGLEVTLARREQWYEKNIQRLQAVVKKAQGYDGLCKLIKFSCLNIFYFF